MGRNKKAYSCLDGSKTFSPVIRKLKDRGAYGKFINTISALSRKNFSDAAICRELSRLYGSFFTGNTLSVNTYKKWKAEEAEVFMASLGNDDLDSEEIKKKYMKMARSCSDIDDFCKLLKYYDKIYKEHNNDNNVASDTEGNSLIEDIIHSLEYLNGGNVGDSSEI